MEYLIINIHIQQRQVRKHPIVTQIFKSFAEKWQLAASDKKVNWGIKQVRIKCNSMPFRYGVGRTIRCKCGCRLALHRT